MGMDFIVSIACLVVAILVGLNLAVFNSKRHAETHDLRMAAYRRRKKAKNEDLRRFLGLNEEALRSDQMNGEVSGERHGPGSDKVNKTS